MTISQMPIRLTAKEILCQAIESAKSGDVEAVRFLRRVVEEVARGDESPPDIIVNIAELILQSE